MRCPFCHEEIQDGALKCRYCLSLLPLKDGRDEQAPRPSSDIWASVTSLVLGLVTALGVADIDLENLSNEEQLGGLLISVLAIIFAGVALGKRQRGRGLAIAGLVLGILCFICFLPG